MPDVDTGNPGSWWRTYKGKYEVTPAENVTMDSTSVMLATVNDVQFTGNATCGNYSMDDPVLTLPEECRPSEDLYIPVVAQAGETTQVIYMHIEPNGYISLEESYEQLTLLLRGVTFNIASNFYASTGEEVE